MSFWPDEINADVVISPIEIMEEAGAELEQKTLRLAVTVRTTQLSDRVVLAFEISNHSAQTTVNLFEVSHQIEQPYPVAIDPPEYRIPEFLTRIQLVPRRPGKIENFVTTVAPRNLQTIPESYVENEWICATPTEFKKKLTELFARDDVKARIITLLTARKAHKVSATVGGESINCSGDSDGAANHNTTS